MLHLDPSSYVNIYPSALSLPSCIVVVCSSLNEALIKFFEANRHRLRHRPLNHSPPTLLDLHLDLNLHGLRAAAAVISDVIIVRSIFWLLQATLQVLNYSISLSSGGKRCLAAGERTVIMRSCNAHERGNMNATMIIENRTRRNALLLVIRRGTDYERCTAAPHKPRPKRKLGP